MLIGILLASISVIVALPPLCCCLCRRCCGRDRNGLPLRSFHARLSNIRDTDIFNQEIDTGAEDRLVYVYGDQYDANEQGLVLPEEGGSVNNSGRYFIPPMPVILHSPHYDEPPPKYEDVVDLSVLGDDEGEASTYDAQQQQPYRDDPEVVYRDEPTRQEEQEQEDPRPSSTTNNDHPPSSSSPDPNSSSVFVVEDGVGTASDNSNDQVLITTVEEMDQGNEESLL